MLHVGRWQIFIVVSITSLAILFALPNLLKPSQLESWPSSLPNKQVALGLDLRGGVHLLLQADRAVVASEVSDALASLMAGALRSGRISAKRLQNTDGMIRFQIKTESQYAKASIIATETLGATAASTANGVAGLGNAAYSNRITHELDDQGILSILLPEAQIRDNVRLAVAQSIEVIRRRVDSLGLSEASIARQGEDRLLVQVPGIEDPERLKEIIGKTARLTIHLVSSQQPDGVTRLPTGLLAVEGETGEEMWVQRRALLSGSNLANASPGFDEFNSPVILFQLDSAGAVRFARATARNVGRAFAIVLDGRVISAPVIREMIPNGSGQISGSYTISEANDLSVLLRAGALPIDLTIVEERVVGPGLGSDSIASGKLAVVVALIAVLVFMLVIYRKFGAIACVALLLNLVIILAALSVLQAALTLPGIAGIILTIGMAVDANVLIFERIKEELKPGVLPIHAVDRGFAQAREPILDANITTIIAGTILFLLGSGPVKGFAVTLSLGIITSVFTAFMVTRILVALWMHRAKLKTLRI